MARWLAALVVLAACAEPATESPASVPQGSTATELLSACTPANPARDIPRGARDSILASRNGVELIDDQLAAIARDIPGGFGGLWQDADGTIVLALVDIAQASAARTALNAQTAVPGLAIPPEARIASVRWNFAQLWEWEAYVLDLTGTAPGLASIDRDEVRNRVVITLTSQPAREALAAALLARDVPCGLFVLELGALPETL